MWRFWLFALLLIFIAVFLARFLSVPQTKQSQVTNFFSNLSIGGHRGCSADAPENTITAFKLAHEHGVQGVEFDIEFTKDSIAIILHDSTVDRTTNGTGPIADFTLEQVRTLNAAAKYKSDEGSYINVVTFPFIPIPTLEEAADFCVQTELKVFFDVKVADIRAVQALLNIFGTHPWLYDNSAVCSFYPWLLYQIKRANPRIITAHTWRRWFFSYQDLDSTIPRHTGIKHYLSVFADLLNVFSLNTWLPKFTGADLLLTHYSEISPAYVRTIRNRGLNLVAWTVNEQIDQFYLREMLKIPYLTDRAPSKAKIDGVKEQRDLLESKR